MTEKNAETMRSWLDNWLDAEPANDTDSLGGINIGIGCPPEIWPVAQMALARLWRQLDRCGYTVLRSNNNRGIWIYDISKPGERRSKAATYAQQQIKRYREDVIKKISYEYAKDGISCRLNWDGWDNC